MAQEKLAGTGTRFDTWYAHNSSALVERYRKAIGLNPDAPALRSFGFAMFRSVAGQDLPGQEARHLTPNHDRETHRPGTRHSGQTEAPQSSITAKQMFLALRVFFTMKDTQSYSRIVQVISEDCRVSRDRSLELMRRAVALYNTLLRHPELQKLAVSDNQLRTNAVRAACRVPLATNEDGKGYDHFDSALLRAQLIAQMN